MTPSDGTPSFGHRRIAWLLPWTIVLAALGTAVTLTLTGQAQAAVPIFAALAEPAASYLLARKSSPTRITNLRG